MSSEAVRSYTQTIGHAIGVTRREMGKDCLLSFAMTYLADYFTLKPSRMHRELAKLLKDGSDSRGLRLAVAAPRGHAKSTLVGTAYALWSICYSREQFIVLLSNTGRQAIDLLTTIKHQLERNALLMQDFPEACEIPGAQPEAARWQQADIVTRNHIRVTAHGTDMKVRGIRNEQHRPTLVLLDDLENEASVRSEDQRIQLKEWFFKAILKLGTRRTNYVVVGTLLHYDSLLASLLDESLTPGWTRRRYQAIERWSDALEQWQRWTAIYTGVEQPHGATGPVAALAYFRENEASMLAGTQVLWPELEDYLALITQRLVDGARSFDSEKQNEPVDPTECLFNPEQFRYWDDEYASIDQLLRALGTRGVIYGACDPSMGKAGKGRDPSAVIVLLRDMRTKTHYVLEAEIGHRSPTALIELILELHTRYKFRSFVVEKTQFQEMFADQLQQVALDRGARLRVKKSDSLTDKQGRIESLEPMITARRLCFCRRHVTLLDHLRKFPHAKHDDGPDALHMAVTTANEPEPRITVWSTHPFWDRPVELRASTVEPEEVITIPCALPPTTDR